jgi:cohesin complex subunit SA-1/2
VLENTVKTEDHATELAKHLSSCFQIRGAHLAVLHRLDSEFIVHIHTMLLNWIGKRIAAYEKNKNKKGLKVAASFFRVLRNLLVAIDNHDALNM